MLLVMLQASELISAKSSVGPIKCTDEDLPVPLKIRKPAKTDLLPLIDRIAYNLRSCKASLLRRVGWLVVVHAIFTGIPIHLMIVSDLPKWVIRAIDKIRLGFLWTGRQNVSGGNLLVSWEKVQRPLQYGGLGYSTLKRWLGPYASDGFGYKSLSTLGYQFRYLAMPKLSLMSSWKQRFGMVRILNSRLIGGCMVIIEYLKLWELVDDLTLQPHVADQHIWKLTSSGLYTSKSAYNAFFVGSIKFAPWKRISKSWAPL
ncbi:LOW QUALITY PROTEIN: hypothetical protein U9M48_027495, partial [Paspalum notatum var. saurae]